MQENLSPFSLCSPLFSSLCSILHFHSISRCECRDHRQTVSSLIHLLTLTTKDSPDLTCCFQRDKYMITYISTNTKERLLVQQQEACKCWLVLHLFLKPRNVWDLWPSEAFKNSKKRSLFFFSARHLTLGGTHYKRAQATHRVEQWAIYKITFL